MLASRQLRAFPRFSRRYPLLLIGVIVLACLHVQINTSLPLSEQWVLLFQAPSGFDQLQFVYGNLPRMALAIMVGAVLGFSGSVLQQLTQNRLVSPMTLGASSGAWLAMVCATIWLPVWAAHSVWPALAGAMIAVAVVVVIAGPQGLGGLPLILSGMALNLLLGAVSAAVVMMHDQYVRNLFLWGSGDLAQNDWLWVSWLWPRLWPAPLVLWLAHRPLMLLRLGSQGAQGRGMRLWPVMLLLLFAALWLSSVAITAVGLIGFIGLLTPNFVRLLGARSVRGELIGSALLGAVLLLATDMLAQLGGTLGFGIVPSGAAAALIGVPGLLWFSRKRQAVSGGQQTISLVVRAQQLKPWAWIVIGASLALLALLSLTLSLSARGWQISWPDDLVWLFRWPRTLAAAAAGIGLAVAGVILQRLLRNPLASPDMLGLSAGSTLVLVLASTLLHRPLQQGATGLAFFGSMGVLLLLLALGRRMNYAPGMMALVGISLSALLDAVLQFALASGSADTFTIVGWLAGSTYRVSGGQSLALAVTVTVLLLLALLGQRSLTLMSISDGVASGRGVNLRVARVAWLVLVSLLTAAVTSVMGPIGFLGLLAPHMAALFGARRVVPQLLLSAGIGSVLLLLADWLGRMVIYPGQAPVGIVASVICGLYFIVLLLVQRARRGWA